MELSAISMDKPCTLMEKRLAVPAEGPWNEIPIRSILHIPPPVLTYTPRIDRRLMLRIRTRLDTSLTTVGPMYVRSRMERVKIRITHRRRVAQRERPSRGRRNMTWRRRFTPEYLDMGAAYVWFDFQGETEALADDTGADD